MRRGGRLRRETGFYFLGILYAGPQYTATGEIKIVTIPDRQSTSTQTYIPINLGNVIRSSKLIDFDRNVLKQITNRPLGCALTSRVLEHSLRIFVSKTFYYAELLYPSAGSGLQPESLVLFIKYSSSACKFKSVKARK